MKNDIFNGIATKLIIPYTLSNGKQIPNIKELDYFLEFQIKNNINAFVLDTNFYNNNFINKQVLYYSSNEEEVHIITNIIRIINNRVPLIVTIENATYDEIIEKSKLLKDLGVSAIILKFDLNINNLSNVSIEDFFIRICDNSILPVIISDNSAIPLSIYNTLSKIPNFIGISSSLIDLNRILKIQLENINKIKIISDNDNYILPSLSIGIVGCISEFSNILPKYFSDLYLYFFNRNSEKELNISRSYNIPNTINMQLNIFKFSQLFEYHDNISLLQHGLHILDFDFISKYDENFNSDIIRVLKPIINECIFNF